MSEMYKGRMIPRYLYVAIATAAITTTIKTKVKTEW